MPSGNQRIVLKERPQGRAGLEHFELQPAPEPEPAAGGVVVEPLYLSVDPAMRGRMRTGRSYVAPFELGEPIDNGAVARVVASRSADLPEGALVLGRLPWARRAAVPARGLRRLPDGVPDATVPHLLGALGMPGLTAYAGLLDVGRPEEGEVVLVSAAAGAVGSLVGQIAKLRGCRAVGIAGGPDKAAHLTGELGFDAAIDYRAHLSGGGGGVRGLTGAILEAAGGGIDVYFDNVGGDHLEAAIEAANDFARIVACGAISVYDADRPVPGPRNMTHFVTRRLRMEGFIVLDRWDRYDAFYRDMSRWLETGAVKAEQTVVEGFERAPEAFLRLFTGEKLGKVVVRV